MYTQYRCSSIEILAVSSAGLASATPPSTSAIPSRYSASTAASFLAAVLVAAGTATACPLWPRDYQKAESLSLHNGLAGAILLSSACGAWRRAYYG